MRFLQQRALLIVCGLFINSQSYCQLLTSTNQSAAQLVQNVLVGNGVTATNISFSGGANAIGSFNATNTNLGLGSGIILTTGTVLSGTGLFGSQEGPHGPNNKANAGMDNGSGGNQQLSAIAGLDTYNATILEFDFVPNSDSIKFKYVFGSEEYPEFVNQGFNDVFAFFITGPGFGGPYNMATIPGTGGTPVTIDNVNANTNSTYFVDNGNGTTAPQNASSTYIQYDGFTTIIEARAKVQCGETYHLKLAIADVGDPEFDSGIFLEANSLTSPEPVSMSSSLTNNIFGNPKILAESCETATITVRRDPSQVGQSLSIPLSTSGTATEGVDYSVVPQNIVFAPGQTAVTFTIDAFIDNIFENDETIILTLDQPDPCGNSNLIELDLIIKEVPELNAQLSTDTIFCTGDIVTLTPSVSGGANLYSYNWSTGATSQSISVSPTVTTSYSVTVSDNCNSTPVTQTANVFVPIYDPFVLNASNDTALLCPNSRATLNASVEGGSGSNVFTWTNGDDILNANDDQSIEVSPFFTTTYNVEVTNLCNDTLDKDITVTILTDVLKVLTIDEQVICKGDEVEIWAEGLGGLGGYTYYWTHSGETTNSILVSPTENTTYEVLVADSCQTYLIKGQVDVRLTFPRASFSVASTNLTEGLPIQFRNSSRDGVSWEWDFGNGETSTDRVPSTTYAEEGEYLVQQIVISEAGCRDSISKWINIKPEFYFYAPNAFTADNDRYNSQYKVSVIGETKFHFLIYNRWGEIIFESFDPDFSWDGTYRGSEVPVGVYVYKAKISDLQEVRRSFEGFITVLK